MRAAVSGTRVSADRQVDDLIQHAFSDLPRPAMPVQVEAMLLKTNRKTLGENLECLASAVYFIARAFVTSTISHLGLAISANRFRPIAAFEFGMYDETPMTFKTDSKYNKVPVTDLAVVPAQ